MGRVTIPTERPATYAQKFDGIKAQMLKSVRGKYTDEEMDVMIKSALIAEANDKIEYSLRGNIRRGKHIKMGLTEEEFEDQWKKKMKDRLKQDGYPFELKKDEETLLASIQDKRKQEAAEEITKIATEAFKKMLQTA